MDLKAENISFSYNKKRQILKDVSLSLNSNKIIGLIGDSGSGKSTLCKILSGYITNYSGEVTLDGNKIPDKNFHPVQLIFQHPEKTMNPKWKMEKVLKESSDGRHERQPRGRVHERVAPRPRDHRGDAGGRPLLSVPAHAQGRLRVRGVPRRVEHLRLHLRQRRPGRPHRRRPPHPEERRLPLRLHLRPAVPDPAGRPLRRHAQAHPVRRAVHGRLLRPLSDVYNPQ